MFDNLSATELQLALANIATLPPDEQAMISSLVEEAIRQRTLQACRDDFLSFVRYMWPGFICGPHHLEMAKQFQLISEGKENRITLSLAPRSGKSMLTSVYFPAWFLGKYPTKKIMQASHKAELAVGFGRQVRELFSDPKFQDVFPGISLKTDNKAAGRWATNKGGSYLAAGVGAGIAGFGADLCFRGDMLVTTDRGDVPISDLVANYKIKKVLARNPDDGSVFFANIIGRGSRFSESMIDIFCDGTTIHCTPNHPFYVQWLGYTEAQYLKPGNLLVRPDGSTNPVESVSDIYYPEGGEVVYNISVEGVQNYFVQRFQIHNCLIDDPHDEQQAIAGIYDPSVYDKAYDWYLSGPRQRLQPGAAVAIIATRWSKIDLIGRLLSDAKDKGADKWKEIKFPALDENGNSYWPEYWPTAELMATRQAIIATGSLWRWNAQYLQNPTSEEGALIKNQWWRHWDRAHSPKCEFIIQSWDTANRTTARSNYSVCTTWGVFHNEEEGCSNIILLDCWRGKLEFPDLKQKALELYKEWEPDSCVIEQKSAGEALITEFRRMGLYVEDYTPTRGDGDKVMRVNAVTDIFASGVVWIMEADWTSTVLDEAQAFPMGENDDIVDTIAMALSRFRRGNFVALPSDDWEDEDFSPTKKADYY